MSMHVLHVADGSLLQAAIMWQVMMIGMMMPVIAPWFRVAFKFAETRSCYARIRHSVVFLCGYLVIWTAYSLIAAVVQVTLRNADLLGEEGALHQSLASGVLIASGLFQFSSTKRACLRHCRNPMTYFLTRWRNRSPSLFRIGLSHGAYCVACCWALMATAFALGVMNVAWMLVIAFVAAAEQMFRAGERMAAVAGLGLIAWGLRLAAQPILSLL
jgi:predicted metal-binding membrane protein